MTSPRIKALYLSVKDMDRAIIFYEEIFGVKVSHRDSEMSSFDFDALSLLLFDPAAAGEKVSYGNNVVPNIEVDDVGPVFELVTGKGCKVVMPVSEIGTYKIFQIEDPEGNVIEFYQNA